MPYDINKYSPKTDNIIKSDGTIVNEGDGYNSDGSQNIVITGAKTITEHTLNNVSVGAGATFTFSGNPVDLQNFYEFGALCNANTSHNYNLTVFPSPDGVVAIGQIANTTSTSMGKVINVTKSPGDYIIYQITNSDTVAHTYDVWTRKIPL